MRQPLYIGTSCSRPVCFCWPLLLWLIVLSGCRENTLPPPGTPLSTGVMAASKALQAEAMIPSTRSDLTVPDRIPHYTIRAEVAPDLLTYTGQEHAHYTNTSS